MGCKWVFITRTCYHDKLYLNQGVQHTDGSRSHFLRIFEIIKVCVCLTDAKLDKLLDSGGYS